MKINHYSKIVLVNVENWKKTFEITLKWSKMIKHNYTFFSGSWVHRKLRRLGIRNQIVDNSDSKLSEFRLRIYNDSDFNVQIGFRLNDYSKIWLKSTNCWFNSTKFNLFLIKILKKMTLMSIKRSKMTKLIRKVDKNW